MIKLSANGSAGMLFLYMIPFWSDRIRTLMEEKGLKEIALAKKSGVGQGTINRILNKATRPRIDTIEKIASALGIPVEALTVKDEKISRILMEIATLSEKKKEDVLEHIQKERLWEESHKDSPRNHSSDVAA